MKKELLTIGMTATASLGAIAGPHGGPHGGPHHGDWWGRGGCRFWPVFTGGVVGGFLSNCFGLGHRTVVVPAAYTTYSAPVVVQAQPVVVQSQQPLTASTSVQTATLPANNTSVSAAKDETILYMDTNNNQRIEGKVLIDAKGNKMLPSSYRVIRVDDLQRQ